MGFANSTLVLLYLNRIKSDIELQITACLQRKLAVQDQCNQISEMLSGTIFQTDNNSEISPPAALPGFVPAYGIAPLNQAPVATGIYETQLAMLQAIEKELDSADLDFQLEAVKAEEESMKKIVDDHAKKDFKIGS